jgi:hypothetical protein
VKERPILFRPEIVRAILEGRKTVTRRVVEPQPEVDLVELPDTYEPEGWFKPGHSGRWSEEGAEGDRIWRCPYGVPGDRLWVRERWQMGHYMGGDEPATSYTLLRPTGSTDRDGRVFYAADGNPNVPRWRPSIYMPRWASRLTLEVTDVGVERVRDITEADALAEGCPGNLFPEETPLAEFRRLWGAINGPRGFGWDANPWVWVVRFKVAEAQREVDRLLKDGR